jgi:hypothetical protein
MHAQLSFHSNAWHVESIAGDRGQTQLKRGGVSVVGDVVKIGDRLTLGATDIHILE